MDQGDWLVLLASKRLLFDASDGLWQDALCAYDRRLFTAVGIKHVLERPDRN